MDNFYQNIKDNLENQPEPKYDPNDWVAMESKLDNSTQPTTNWLRYWYVPFLFILLASQCFLYTKWRSSMKQVDTLNGRLSAFLEHNLRGSDTLFISQTTHARDTIYIDRSLSFSNTTRIPTYANKHQSTFPNTHLGFPLLSPLKLGSTMNMQIAQAANSFNQFSQLNRKTSELKKEKHQVISGKSSDLNQDKPDQIALNPLNISRLGFLDKPQTIDPLLRHAAQNRPENHSFIKYKKRLFDEFKLQEVSVDVGLGPLNTKDYIFDYKNEIATSLGANLRFSKSVEFWLGATFSVSSFEVEDLDETSIPQIDPPTPELEFKLVESNRLRLLYSIGMMYTHPTSKRWRPQVGIGLNASHIFAHDRFYEYQNPITQAEWTLEQNIPAQFNIADYAVLKAGIKYAITRDWRSFIRYNYYHGLHGQLNSPAMQSLNLGLSYTF